MTKTHHTQKILVVGCGPTGMLAAIYFSKLGFEVTLVGILPQIEDNRTTALMVKAIDFLKELDLWKGLKLHAAPLRYLRLVDGTDSLIRSPTIRFKASEIKKGAFGYNIPNKILNNTLLKNLQNVKHIEAKIKDIMLDNVISCCLDNNEVIKTDIIIAADGKNSLIRQLLNIKTKEIKHNQAALISKFSHELPHEDTSTEIHTNSGPFTQVPLLENNSSLIWTVHKNKVENICKLSKNELNKQIEVKLNYILGKINLTQDIQIWNLSSSIAEIFAKDNIFLIGEAAHSFPPIGAQGLNLSIRDIQDCGEALMKNSQNSCALYNKSRSEDINSRSFVVNKLNQSLIYNNIIWQLIRAGSLETIRKFKPLRKLFIKEGIEPSKFILKLTRLLL